MGRKKMQVFARLFIMIVSCLLLFTGCNQKDTINKGIHTIGPTAANTQYPYTPKVFSTPPPFDIEKINFKADKDKDGIADADDFVEGARIQVQKKPKYIPDYFTGGYPPEDIAVCTDIVWRAFKNAGYDLKTMVDTDIKLHTKDYPRVDGKPDPNIDFRRVLNLVPFFKKYGTLLTKEIKPYDRLNLKEWQRGDLVVFYWGSIEHIAVVSDQRNSEGVPLLIHTYGSYPMEDDKLIEWSGTIAYHFRYPKHKDK